MDAQEKLKAGGQLVADLLACGADALGDASTVLETVGADENEDALRTVAARLRALAEFLTT